MEFTTTDSCAGGQLLTPLDTLIAIVENGESCESSTKKNRPTSNFTGVSWDRISKKWRVQMNIDGKTSLLGRFDTEEDAAFCYNERATLLGRKVYLLSLTIFSLQTVPHQVLLLASR